MKREITYEEALWNYLTKKLSILNDNNKTARQIYNWIAIQNGKSLRLGGFTLEQIEQMKEELNAVGNEHTAMLNELSNLK